MARVSKGRYVRALLFVAISTGALWGVVGWKSYRPNLGLDLQGGISVVLCPRGPEPGTCGTADAGSLEKAVDIIRQRVDALGVAEPEIATQGETILIQLPGLKDQQRALELIGTTAKLRFRPVIEFLGQPTPEQRKADKTLAALPDCTDPDTWQVDDPSKPGVFCVKQRTNDGKVTDPSTWSLLRLEPVRLEGDKVQGADAELPPATAGGVSEWQVSIRFNSEGSAAFKKVTGELACKPAGDPTRQLAIVLDRVVESHPTMGDEVGCNQGIDSNAVISGGFGESEAKDLGLVLRYGALPIELDRLDTTTITPTLGKESLRSGILAAVIGLGIVFLYMLLFYRTLGLVVWLGIGLHGAITFGIISVLGEIAGFALSLAGIAGLIVSLGIAADSFIVYFERIKDEVAGGRTVRAAIDRAWPSARRTIVAADLVTALAATVLYFLAVGNVRGFALMLGLSTSLDLVVSYMYMHPITWLLAQTRLLRSSKTLGVQRNARAAAPVPARSGA